MNLFYKRYIRTSIAIAATFGCGPALADASGNVALTSDYVFRDFSQTQGDPAIQGGFDFAHDNGLYTGVWAFNVESDPAAPVNYDGANMGTDIYGGLGGANFNAMSIDVSFLRYQDPGTGTNNTDEFHMGAGHETIMAPTTLTLHYSPDYFGTDKAFYWDLGIDIPLPKNVTFAAHYGLTDYDDNTRGDDYGGWRVGLSADRDGFEFDLSYIDISGVSGACDTPIRVALYLTVSRSL